MKRLALCLALVAMAAAPAQALTLSLHPDNVGIEEWDYDVDYDNQVIEIWELWTSTDPGFIMFDCEGQDFYDWVVIKYVYNETGEDWTRFANELLDPAGSDNDEFDQANEAWVPERFSHSNNGDGLSFDQGGDIPRLGDPWESVLVDELNTRDFLDYYDGVVYDGEAGAMLFGLDAPGSEQPFLLAQRPNASSIVPEPGTLLLMGLGLAGGALRRRFRRQA